LEERALADSDDSDRFVEARYGDAISSFVGTIQRLAQVQRERDAALAALARVEALLNPQNAMAAGSIGSDRYFCESDIRAVMEATS
jgi:hypothetical protein